MPNRTTDSLYTLVKSLTKAEKRNFKLFAQRNTAKEDLKTVELFDALDRMDSYDEDVLEEKLKTIVRKQLPNIKSQLYTQVLSSLRLIRNEENVDILLHEQMDYARILYNKGLYHQSLKMLEKIKETAKQTGQISYQIQGLFLEKKIESVYITRSMRNKAAVMASESNELSEAFYRINLLSNLSLNLYSWYIEHGHARNEEEEIELTRYFHEEKKDIEADDLNNFYEKQYFFQSYCWYHFIMQDFSQYYRYSHKWAELFEQQPEMKPVETAYYIKALHNLMSSYFDLGKTKELKYNIERLESDEFIQLVSVNQNEKILHFIYLYVAKINLALMTGDFKNGIKLVPFILEKLDEYSLYIDTHRILIFYYKIACLYFGDGDYSNAINYLMKIINWKMDLRSDLQCYARLLLVICHYELKNYDLLEYLVKSVYRFMSKMENLGMVENEI
ncbi:MAG: hypothetical protein JWN76_2041, partial [Chitinophagaceae bacterium]|nr:hypothetical protein [Chitinophagaceae bacterium]